MSEIRINYYAPQIFQSIGLTGPSAGLFATGVYGIVKIVVTAIGLMAFTEQLGRKVGDVLAFGSGVARMLRPAFQAGVYLHILTGFPRRCVTGMDTHSNSASSGRSSLARSGKRSPCVSQPVASGQVITMREGFIFSSSSARLGGLLQRDMHTRDQPCYWKWH